MKRPSKQREGKHILFMEESRPSTVTTSPPVQLPRFWSVRVISSRWNISRQQIYRAHKAGQLRGFRILGTLRFLEEDLLDLLRREGVPLTDGDGT